MAKVVSGAFPKIKLDDVVGWERAAYSLGGKAPRYNPDNLVRHKGFAIYEQMRDDEQVKAVMQFRRDAVMGRGWQLVFDEGSKLPQDEQKERIRIMTALLRRGMEGSFEDGLNCIWTARDFGFSMTEKIFTNVDVPGDKTRVGLRMLLRRFQNTFQFITDDYGMLVKALQQVNGREQEVDLTKFIYYVQNPEFDRYWGRSELREAYKPWFIKQRIDDFWALYLERFAGGFLILTQDTQSNLVPNSPTYKALQDVLMNLHGASGIILPKGITAQLLFPPANSSYEDALTAKDLAIAKACLVPNLLGLSHTGQTGAFAQSQTQLEAFIWTLNMDGNRMCVAVDKQLLYDLGEKNWGDDEYPCFRFNPASVEHIKWIIDSWQKLTLQGDVVPTEKDEQVIRALLNMPPREEGDKPLELPADKVAQQQAQDAHGLATDAQGHAQDIANREQARADKQQQIDQSLGNRELDVKRIAAKAKKTKAKAKKFADNGRRTEHGDQGRRPTDGRSAVVPHGLLTATRSEFNRAAQRVMFSVIENRQSTAESGLVAESARLVSEAVDRALGTDEQMADLMSRPDDIPDIEFGSADLRRLHGAMKSGLNQSWNSGLEMARNETERAQKIANMTRRTVFADLKDRAAQFLQAKSYQLAGDLSDGVKKVIQQELLNAVKTGRAVSETREAIWSRIVDKGFTTRTWARDAVGDDANVQRGLDRLWVDSEEQAASYLETLARTSLYEAFNEARMAEFMDPELSGFVVAIEYSAILDDRTTELCERLNGQVHPPESDFWETFRPPNHFNCRAIPLAITSADGWDGEESDVPPDLEPAGGFK